MNLTQQTKSPDNLSEALAECKVFAKRGHILANDAVSLLNRVVNNVSEKLQNEIMNLQGSNYNDNATTGSLASQLSLIRSNFEILPQQLVEDINALSKTSFSITLFGRTMAGKSTLMEILIHGNGDSIGKGAQRTTRDVRTYNYKNLQITDVPGIAAFEGEDDENIAFDAAKKSDLILFLITDDAPQACEAECLNRILELGKPVICLINIKADINTASSLKMFKRDVQKKFDNERLETIKKQFFDFGNQYGQDWRNIRFAYVHLKSAFLSQQREFKVSSFELYNLSRFGYVENLIISEVCKNGSFYKLKAFTDIVVVPVVISFNLLLRAIANSRCVFDNVNTELITSSMFRLIGYNCFFNNSSYKTSSSFFRSPTTILSMWSDSFFSNFCRALWTFFSRSLKRNEPNHPTKPTPSPIHPIGFQTLNKLAIIRPPLSNVVVQFHIRFPSTSICILIERSENTE